MVFEIGGVIDLEMKGIEIEEPQVYIAGQTAPGPGITLIRGGFSIKASQCVLQHLRVRPGDAGQAKKSGWDPDSITTTGGPVDVWIDHCTTTWSCDENITAATYKSPTGEPAQAHLLPRLHRRRGPGQCHARQGPALEGHARLRRHQEVAIVRCLYASKVERNPVFKPDTSGVVVNSVIGNPGQRAIHAHAPRGDGQPAQGPHQRGRKRGPLRREIEAQCPRHL